MGKYAFRTGRVWCESCRVQRRRFIKYDNGLVCEAWQGDFDEWDNPTDNGELFMPGVRTCGHRDCVNPDHIQGWVVQPKKSGRPAKVVDPDEVFIQELMKGKRG